MNRIGRCLAVAGCLLASAWARADAPFSFGATPGALPKDVVPIEHVVHLVPDAASHRFRGEQRVLLDVRRTTREIRLHALELEVTSASLGGNGLPRTVLGAPRVDADRQMLVFTPPRALRPGRYRLSMTWRGVINTTAEAFFLDPYRGPAGERALLATDFEPTGARRLLPCWDEPAFRARFRFSVDLPAASTAVSNMPAAKRVSIGDGLVRTTFAATPAMPSYLIALVAGELERTEGVVDGTRIGIVTTEGKRASAAFALAAARELLHDFNGYFGTPYPLPKLDHIALPGGFSGAMENWGAIIYNEAALLVAPGGSEQSKQRVYGTVAHETAHQWFGNLVTMAWWDDLWLNEGFASWMETKASDHFNPTWGALLDRVGGREAAMGLDGFATTHPVVQHIRTVEETNQAFDTITYQKGEAVISMLEAYAGADTWRDGLRAYMKDRAYGNATTQDLWRAVEAAGATGLTAIANDFTTQPGIPLIRVAEARCVGGATRLVLEQSEFSRDRKATVAAQPLRWRVPLLLTSLGGKPTRIVLGGGRGEATLAGCAPVVVNGGQLGYFRTLYPAPALAGLTKALPKLAPIDQLGLVKDNLALSRASYQAMAPALDLLSAVPARGDANVAAGAVEEWSTLYDSLAVDPAEQAKLGKLIAKQWRRRMTALRFEPRAGETLPQAQLRTALIAMLGKQGDPAVAAEARRRFVALAANPRALDGPLKTAWLRIVATNATRAEWDALAALAKSSTGLVERSTYFGLLGRASDPVLAQATLDLALTDTAPQTTRAAMIRQVAENHGDLAFAFAMANRSQIAALIDDSAKANYFARLAATAQKPETIAALENFAAGLKPDQRKPVDRTLGQIRQRLADSAGQVAGTKAWLAARK